MITAAGVDVTALIICGVRPAIAGSIFSGADPTATACAPPHHAGRGKVGDRARLQARASLYHSRPRLRFLGHANPDEVPFSTKPGAPRPCHRCAEPLHPD